MRQFLEGLINLLMKVALWLSGLIAVIVAFFQWFTDLIVDLTTWAFTEIGQFSAPNFEFSLSDHSSVLALANHFLPVAEMWAFVVVSVPYFLFLVILRFVKQWIPTLSN